MLILSYSLTSSLIYSTIITSMNQKETCVSHTFCQGKASGTCYLADYLRFQAENGTIAKPGLDKNLWKRDLWLQFQAGIKAKLNICELPDQLAHALKTVQPNFVED